MAKDINQPGIDPKELKKQERNKLYQQLAKERLEKKQAKQVGRQKVQEEYRKQKKEIDEIEKVCKTDIVNKLDSLKQEVFQKKIGKKEAKSLFKTYRNDRIKQFRLDEQKILNLTSDELKQRFSFRIKRWFFGIGKEFSRVTWMGGREVLKGFAIILILVGIMALIFLGLDYLIGIIPRK